MSSISKKSLSSRFDSPAPALRGRKLAKSKLRREADTGARYAEFGVGARGLLEKRSSNLGNPSWQESA